MQMLCWLKVLTLASVLVPLIINAQNTSTGADAPVLKNTIWTLQDYQCPSGCSNHLQEILNSQIGQSIDFSGQSLWKSGTGDTCKQLKSATQSKRITAELQRQIKLSTPRIRQIKDSDLKLPSPKVWVIDVLCSGEEGQALSHRFMLNTLGYLVTIDEESSILIYHPK